MIMLRGTLTTMDPRLLQPDQRIDIGETNTPTPVTVITANLDGLNPFAVRVTTLELRYPLLIPIEARVKVIA
jgi:hypothetical protein